MSYALPLTRLHKYMVQNNLSSARGPNRDQCPVGYSRNRVNATVACKGASNGYRTSTTMQVYAAPRAALSQWPSLDLKPRRIVTGILLRYWATGPTQSDFKIIVPWSISETGSMPRPPTSKIYCIASYTRPTQSYFGSLSCRV